MWSLIGFLYMMPPANLWIALFSVEEALRLIAIAAANPFLLFLAAELLMVILIHQWFALQPAV
jgi:hypothetical protein